VVNKRTLSGYVSRGEGTRKAHRVWSKTYMNYRYKREKESGTGI